MLCYDKMTFRAEDRGCADGKIDVTGELRVTAGRRVEWDHPSPDQVYQELRREVWRVAYGELQDPVRELLDLATIYVRPEHQYRIKELGKQILAAIAAPGPLPEHPE